MQAEEKGARIAHEVSYALGGCRISVDFEEGEPESTTTSEIRQRFRAPRYLLHKAENQGDSNSCTIPPSQDNPSTTFVKPWENDPPSTEYRFETSGEAHSGSTEDDTSSNVAEKGSEP
jgi:hypothetical protein